VDTLRFAANGAPHLLAQIDGRKMRMQQRRSAIGSQTND
jgi:hypothetical protein